MHQYGITADTARWGDYIRQMREWLTTTEGPTSIPYRVEGLDAKGVYPKVYTATPVQCTDGSRGWVYGHVLDLDDSMLIAAGRFQDEDCPKIHFLEDARN